MMTMYQELYSDASDASFDCASWLEYGVQYPHNEKKQYGSFHPVLLENSNYCNLAEQCDQDYSFSVEKLRQYEMAMSLKSTISDFRDYFTADEYNDLLACIDQGLDDFTNADRELEQILNISELSDDQLNNIDASIHNTAVWNGRASPNTVELLLWNQLSDTQLCQLQSLTNDSIPDFQFMVDEHLQGFGEKRPEHWEPREEDENRKRRLCRHFLKGHCKRGKACDFLHDPSIFCPDYQKVFLGGLPAHITEAILQEKLTEQGYTVINKPKVLRGFTPQVCLGSVEEAQQLIKKGRIFIDGSQVDVRPYEAFAKDGMDKRLPDDTKRSVFIGGLSNGTTSQMIIDDLEKLDIKVVNHPRIKTGFTHKVTVGTVEQAHKLIKMKKVRINHSFVDIRPYVNFRDSNAIRKKKY